MKSKRTERGWAGHFICADRCMFRRNTLLELGGKRIVVSTVGALRLNRDDEDLTTIGHRRYYETMAFEAKKDGAYWDADVSKEISLDSDWAICADDTSDLSDDIDNKANEMHETVVNELTNILEGE